MFATQHAANSWKPVGAPLEFGALGAIPAPNRDNAANGLNDVHWVKVLVDPSSRDVFAFQPQIVPANRVAVPAP